MTLAFRPYGLTAEEAKVGLELAKELKSRGMTSEQGVLGIQLVNALKKHYTFRSAKNAHTDGIQRANLEEHADEQAERISKLIHKINSFIQVRGY